MTKELPWFKFFSGEWNRGDITLENYQTQGLFINICAYYWERECHLNLNQLRKRFQNHASINTLIEGEIICIDGEAVVISFLNEQYSELKANKKLLSEAGIKGNKIRWEKNLKQKNESPPDSQVMAKRSRPDHNIEEDKEEDYSKHYNFLKQLKEKKYTAYATWLDGVCRKHGLSNGKIWQILEKFCDHLKVTEKIHIDINRFKKHFVNWLDKQDQHKMLDQYKTRRVGAL